MSEVYVIGWCSFGWCSSGCCWGGRGLREPNNGCKLFVLMLGSYCVALLRLYDLVDVCIWVD
ncbi:unnamed protein product [Chondrus crispus]|uniref:Uncharacterized protein n=1 Tax=Chondrus crispus TaxID=2769 RepID=R7QD72_CHOCR|nr:unnamed protein product [Chondrus crispus]CDF35994.1 unnamed protein product [Chondrus crispus]|eukprot:XP_005715813.1 unnamed protein product [Chondrus crispus]